MLKTEFDLHGALISNKLLLLLNAAFCVNGCHHVNPVLQSLKYNSHLGPLKDVVALLTNFSPEFGLNSRWPLILICFNHCFFCLFNDALPSWECRRAILFNETSECCGTCWCMLYDLNSSFKPNKGVYSTLNVIHLLLATFLLNFEDFLDFHYFSYQDSDCSMKVQHKRANYKDNTKLCLALCCKLKNWIYCLCVTVADLPFTYFSVIILVHAPAGCSSESQLLKQRCGKNEECFQRHCEQIQFSRCKTMNEGQKLKKMIFQLLSDAMYVMYFCW